LRQKQSRRIWVHTKAETFKASWGKENTAKCFVRTETVLIGKQIHQRRKSAVNREAEKIVEQLTSIVQNGTAMVVGVARLWGGAIRQLKLLISP
jgi:hypothetical protein